MKKTDSTRTLVLCALLSAGALALGYLETLLPLPLPIPGARLGLGNVMVLLALLLLGKKAACAVAAVKVALSALLFGSPISFLYAAAGTLLALTGMLLLNGRKAVSPIGQSMAGATLHNLGQVLVAMALTATPRLMIYFSFLTPLGLLTGALSGFIAQKSASLLKKNKRGIGL